MMWGNAGRFMRHNSSTSSDSSDDSQEERSSAEYAHVSDGGSDGDSCPMIAFSDTLCITRRAADFGTIQTPPAIANSARHNWQNVRNISALQIFSREHTKQLLATFPISLWKVLGAMLDQSKITQTKVLSAVSTLLTARERQVWPMSRQIIDNKLSKFGCISSRWTRTATIDLSHIALPSLHDPVEFKFIDPVVAWVFCAERLSRTHTLFFEYRERLHPETGERLYGSSVQHGQIMLKACQKIPRSSSFRTGPALFGLSWDAGNASKRRSYTPILVSVGNTDYSGCEQCVCIGFMPQLKLLEKDQSTPQGRQIKNTSE